MTTTSTIYAEIRKSETLDELGLIRGIIAAEYCDRPLNEIQFLQNSIKIRTFEIKTNTYVFTHIDFRFGLENKYVDCSGSIEKFIANIKYN